ncbi:MAG TPA: branched-chain amino acid ABC transporter permease [Mycobacteriales bacterium]
MTLLQLLVSGVLLGGLYSLIAMGLTLIFGVMRLVNFAHGEFVTLGMYAAFWFYLSFGGNPYLSAILVVPLSLVAGWMLERTMFRRMRSAPPAMQMLVTFGLSLALQNAMLLAFGGDYRSVRNGFAQGSLHFGTIDVGVGQLIAFVASILIGAGLIVALKYTRIGRALRAVQENRYAIALMGVNVERLFGIAFAIGICLAALAGVLIAPNYFISPTVGGGLVFTGFVVVVLGGLGSLGGAVVGGMIIGVVESVAGFYLPGNLKGSFSLAVFILVLLLRPAGLFGRRGAEEVGFK